MKAVVIHSGGLDSTVLLYSVIEKYGADGVHAIRFNYQQRHSLELLAARDICRRIGVSSTSIDLSDASRVFRGSSQTSRHIEVPKGHYAEESMKATVVPNRNMVMIALAAAFAITINVEEVYYGAHAGDHFIYPDCRPAFIDAMAAALVAGNVPPIQLFAPFATLTKRDIVLEGSRLFVPFAETYSCYVGRNTHCGQCGTCVERKEAFLLAGVADPTEYDVPTLWAV